MTTLYLTHPAFLLHNAGEYHPESADRLRAIDHILEHEDFAFLLRDEAPRATTGQLLRAHSLDHVEFIFSSLPPEGAPPRQLDDDTAVSSQSGEAALRAAGAVCRAVDEVAGGAVRNAFCAVRPPGHHAEHDAAMGFCLFSNAAIGALHAQAAHGYRRVAVVDFDVHHGNGTQNILWDQPGMFYASTHQRDAYPYSGGEEEAGGAGGARVVNRPLEAGSGSEAFRAAYSRTILPELAAFAPELLIISAGFDAHAADPMADLNLQVADFAWLTRELLQVAASCCAGRVVSVLEGGYDTRALAASVAAHLRALMEG